MADSSDADTELIASSPDVVLVVGKPPKNEQERPEARLLVSSTTLISSSKVFAAMLGPSFREGRELKNSTPPMEIRLPEDDAVPMSQM